MSVPDPVFLQLAKQLGQPRADIVEQLVALHEVMARAGPAPALFDLAVEKGLLGQADAARMLELAAAQPIRPSGRSPAVKQSSGRQTPVKQTSGRQTPLKQSSGRQTPVKQSSGRQTPVKQSSGRQTPVKQSSGRQTALPKPAAEPEEEGRPPIALMVAGGAGLLGLLVVGLVLSTSKSKPPEPTVATAPEVEEKKAETPKPRPAPTSTLAGWQGRVSAMSDEAWGLVEEGQARDALERIDRLVVELHGDAAAADGVKALLAVHAEIQDYMRDTAVRERNAVMANRKEREREAIAEWRRNRDARNAAEADAKARVAADAEAEAKARAAAEAEAAAAKNQAAAAKAEKPEGGASPAVETLPAIGDDPVPPLAGEEEALLAKGKDQDLDEKAVARLVASFVDRAEKAYTARDPAPEGFLAWLRRAPKLRAAFWLALHPTRDRVDVAMRVLDRLRQLDPAAVEQSPHLAVAFAVVWDEPSVLDETRKDCVWGIDTFTALPDLETVWRHFTDPRMQARFANQPKDLVWPVLVYVVDMDVTAEEIAWGLEKYEAKRHDLGQAYDDLVYDTEKASRRPPKLGKRPYTLMNLKTYGGICGDQAHYSSRLAKMFCVPATKVSGETRFGGVGHAWVGYLKWIEKRPRIMFSGRYQIDYYYTGMVLDPQTREEVLDRRVAMMLDGAGKDYERHVSSLVLARMARGLVERRPQVSLGLTINALMQDRYCAPGWLLLMEHVKLGNVDPRLGTQWLDTMFSALGDHPDITLTAFDTFMACIPLDDTRRRDRYWDTATKLYQKNQRPDLLITLVGMQAEELVARADRQGAVTVLLSTAAAHPKESIRIMPLVRRADTLLRELGRLDKAIPTYEDIVGKMPRTRDTEPSVAFGEMVDVLARAYDDCGLSAKADALRAREKR